MLVELPNGKWVEADKVIKIEYTRGGGPHEGRHWVNLRLSKKFDESASVSVELDADASREKAQQLVTLIAHNINQGKTKRAS